MSLKVYESTFRKIEYSDDNFLIRFSYFESYPSDKNKSDWNMDYMTLNLISKEMETYVLGKFSDATMIKGTIKDIVNMCDIITKKTSKLFNDNVILCPRIHMEKTLILTLSFLGAQDVDDRKESLAYYEIKIPYDENFSNRLDSCISHDTIQDIIVISNDGKKYLNNLHKTEDLTTYPDNIRIFECKTDAIHFMDKTGMSNYVAMPMTVMKNIKF